MYAKIQRKYWGVGFLRYYQIRQIPNFILALPILMVSFFTIFYFILQVLCDVRDRNYPKKKKENEMSVVSTVFLLFPIISIFDAENISIRTARTYSTCVDILKNPLSVHLVHLLVVTMLGILVAHVQIVTRLICSSCPLIYLGFALLLSNSSHTLNHYFSPIICANVKYYLITYILLYVFLCTFLP